MVAHASAKGILYARLLYRDVSMAGAEGESSDKLLKWYVPGSLVPKETYEQLTRTIGRTHESIVSSAGSYVR